VGEVELDFLSWGFKERPSVVQPVSRPVQNRCDPVFGRETATSPSSFRSCRLYDFSGLLRDSVRWHRSVSCRPWGSCGFDVSVCSLPCFILRPSEDGGVTDAAWQCQHGHNRLAHAHPSEPFPMFQRRRRHRLWIPSRRWEAAWLASLHLWKCGAK